MIISSGLPAYGVRRRTLHTFAVATLAPGDESGIAWWNPANHAEPIPWRINRSYARIVNTFLAAADSGRRSLDDLGDAFQLWCVDAAGVDLFQMALQLEDSPGVPGAYGPLNGTTRAYGLRFRLRVLLAGAAATVELGDPCVLLWDFLDETETTRLPVPLL